MSYSIQSGNVDNVFAIDGNGAITLNQPLNREETSSYILSIMARDGALPLSEEKSSLLSVVVTVDDVNDNAPIFVQIPCELYVSDDSALNSVAFKVTATDIDFGANGDVQYRISNINDQQFLNLFTLDASTGDFTVKADLSLGKNYPSGREFQFTMTATDKASSPLSTDIQCTARITGENKYSPVLSHPDSLTVVAAGVYNGYHIIKLNASDEDSGPDGALTFLFTSGNEEGVFDVSSSGQITIKRVPSNGFYNLQVAISDQASISKRRSISCEVLVYFQKLSTESAGQVTFGNKTENNNIAVQQGDTVSVPIYIQLGLNNLEGIDVDLSLLGSIGRIQDVVSDYDFIKISDTKVKVFGLTNSGEQVYGIQKIADVKVDASSPGNVQFSVDVNTLVNQQLEKIASGTPPTTACTKTESWDIVSDCKLDIEDAAYIQTYVREQNLGFTTSLGHSLKYATPEKKSAMDVDKNGRIDEHDARHLVGVLRGDLPIISSFNVQEPNTTKKNAEKCSLFIETQLQVKPFDRNAASVSDFKMYVLFTHADGKLRQQLQSSGVSRVSTILMTETADVKYVDVVDMSRNGAVFTLEMKSSTISLSDAGISFAFVNIQKEVEISTTMKKSSTASNKVYTLTLDARAGSIGVSDEPQVKQSILVTSHRCNNPLQKMRMTLRLEGDFDTYVLNKEEEFKTVFKSHFESHMLVQHNKIVVVDNIQVSKGSVVVSFDVEHEPEASDAIVNNVIDDIENNNLNIPFQGNNYPAKPSLLVDDVEHMKSSEEENDKTTLYIAIGVLVGLLLLLAVILLIYCCVHRKSQNNDFERKGSDPYPPKDLSMLSQNDVVNNAYEYFNSLENRPGALSPTTRTVVGSMKRSVETAAVESDYVSAPPAMPLQTMKETQSSLRRRNTPKSLSEIYQQVAILFS